ncbi:MAG TPA: GGDEF domain-containing protein, partial [Butyricicoccus pullicaecorum]|nr:GGDEF domain-containing protein [Butyricicoccus pullicaecorum]
SCLFALLGLYWSLCYAARLSYLDHLHLQNTTLQKALAFRQVQEAQLAAASNQDALTGLPNRRAAQQTLTHWLEQDTPFALCLIDLDGLKQVNDVQGHNQGDQYILTVSGLLQHACRKDEDALFRFGGDEFILLFHNMTRDSARQRLESISEALAQTEANMPMAFSYGIALRQPNDTLDTIIQRADAQMYDMKHAHKSRQFEGRSKSE